MTRASVDVLVVNYRTGALTGEAVARLAPVARVWVWDNSGELLEENLPGATLLSCGANILYAAASNRLYERSREPLVLLLNPDARCTADDLDALVAALQSAPDCWGAAPRLVDENGADQNYRRRLPTLAMLLADRLPAGRWIMRRPWARLYCLDLDPAEPGSVEQPAAACLLLRRDRAGAQLFDEAYGLFGNDLDLARRLARTGPCRYVPEVVVQHVGGASFNAEGGPSRGWMRQQYDDALRRYARLNLRGWWLLEPIFLLRKAATRVLSGNESPPDATSWG